MYNYPFTSSDTSSTPTLFFAELLSKYVGLPPERMKLKMNNREGIRHAVGRAES